MVVSQFPGSRFIQKFETIAPVAPAKKPEPPVIFHITVPWAIGLAGSGWPRRHTRTNAREGELVTVLAKGDRSPLEEKGAILIQTERVVQSRGDSWQRG